MVDQDTVTIAPVPTGLDDTAVGIGIDGITVVGSDIETVVKTSLPGNGVDPPAVSAGDSFPLHHTVVYSAPAGDGCPSSNPHDRISRFL